MPRDHKKGKGCIMGDLIDRQEAIDLAMQYCPDDDGTCSKADEDIRNLLDELEDLPSADGVSKKDVLGWLLAYHTKSFDLKGRYYPHEVIGWLVADISKNLFADMIGEQE